jgi:predicted DNA-binding transcriptional regulator YafY
VFTFEEVAEIRRLAEEARQEAREDSARTLNAVLAKLEALSGLRASRDPLELFEEVLPVPERAVDPAILTAVRRAMEHAQPIRIRYRANRTGEVTTRSIRPFNIHFYNGQEYVEAYCELRGADRIFALGNIEQILGGEPGALVLEDPGFSS